MSLLGNKMKICTRCICGNKDNAAKKRQFIKLIITKEIKETSS